MQTDFPNSQKPAPQGKDFKPVQLKFPVI